MDRDQFIGRVASAAMNASLPDPPAVPERLPDLPNQDLVALFHDRAQDVEAVVHGPMSRHGVPKTVTGIASGHQSRTFMAWDDLPAAGVATALVAANVARMTHEVPADGRLEHQKGYARIDLGVTGAIAGLAESGSVVLSHGVDRPRMASLVPEVHVALLDTGLIERTLVHWAHKRPGAAADTTNLVVVTGPSRTGDIELQLNLGVHGPRHVHIVLIK